MFHVNSMAQPIMKKAHLPTASLALALALGLLAQPAAAQNYKRGQSLTLNFVGADIEAVARTMALITGRTVVVDPRVKGNINLQSESKLTPSAAWDHFLIALRMQGFSVVSSDGIDRLIPESDAKLQNSPVYTGPVDENAGRRGGGSIATQIFKLNNENANNLLPILRPLISPNNTINVNPGNNSLVITDYVDNLQRMARIIASVDQPTSTDVEIIPLRHANASDLVPLISKLLEEAQAGPGAGASRNMIVGESRSNAIIVRASSPAKLALIRSFIARLDVAAVRNRLGDSYQNIHVVHLKNAEATKLAVTLRAIIQSDPAYIYGGSAAGPAGVPPAPLAGVGGGQNTTTQVTATSALNASGMPSTGGVIQADPATNTLIITAPEPQYRQLRAVIDRLDERRAQVYVEALIAEVNTDRASQLGIQWQLPVGQKGDGSVGIIGTNYSSATGNPNIIDLAIKGAAGTVLPAGGINLGLGKLVNGRYVLAALANILERTGDANILSTPNIVTLDNEEARIMIGQNVPFVTGTYTNSSSTSTNGTVNPFQTIERKDVGLTLRVKPQISANGNIKMQVFQEVSNVISTAGSSGPTTNKRAIETNILVQDGSVVVLGGLIQDDYGNNLEKVPFLGDLPIVGGLFRSEGRKRKKTNLMIFLRPTVMRDATSTENLSMSRYDLMQSSLAEGQPERVAGLDGTGGSPVLAAPVNSTGANEIGGYGYPPPLGMAPNFPVPQTPARSTAPRTVAPVRSRPEAIVQMLPQQQASYARQPQPQPQQLPPQQLPQYALQPQQLPQQLPQYVVPQYVVPQPQPQYVAPQYVAPQPQQLQRQQPAAQQRVPQTIPLIRPAPQANQAWPRPQSNRLTYPVSSIQTTTAFAPTPTPMVNNTYPANYWGSNPVPASGDGSGELNAAIQGGSGFFTRQYYAPANSRYSAKSVQVLPRQAN